MNFNERLTELRLARNISQAELAKKLGLSKSTISMYEQGRREPSFEIEELLADYFNVDLDYLRGKSELTTQIVDSDLKLLIDTYKNLDSESKGRLLGYARGLNDIRGRL